MDQPVGVVGLGYVGAALATVLADAGFDVLGVDRDAARVRAVAAGQVPFPGHEPDLAELLARTHVPTSCELADLAGARVVLVCVETPIDETHVPRYAALRSVLAELGPVLAPGALVVVESTLAPGTMRRVVIPALEAATGGRLHERFHVGHCPERVTSGRLVQNLRTLARVCGASSPAAAAQMIALYSKFVQADLDPTDLETAELVKTAENAYRDVQLAFANELAILCEHAGGDFREVRRLVNKSPGRDVLFAGAGVGGHCIPKDSWLLAAGAPAVTPWLLAAARRRNDAMPAHVLDCTAHALGSLHRKKLAVLGLTYREDTGDTRAAPAEQFVRLAHAAGAELALHDPFVAPGPLAACARDADALVILVGHTAYGDLPFAELGLGMRQRVLVDARSGLSDPAAALAGFHVVRVGLSRAHSP